MVGLEFTVAPGTFTALLNRNDSRAFYTFTGDLSQTGIIERALRDAGFDIVKSDVYPGFPRNQEEEFNRALQYLFDHRIPGWSNQEHSLIRQGICTRAEFDRITNRTLNRAYWNILEGKCDAEQLALRVMEHFELSQNCISELAPYLQGVYDRVLRREFKDLSAFGMEIEHLIQGLSCS